MEFKNLKKDLKAKIEEAEEIAIENIQNGINFSPYIYFGDKNVQKMMSSSLDEAIEMAEEEIEEMAEETVVLIYANLIKLNDGTLDAIVSQIYNEEEDDGYSFGLLYKIEDGKIKFLNERVSLGNVRNCLIY